MKIVVVVPSLHRGGAERVVSRLSREWAKQHEVIVAVFDAGSPAYVWGGRLEDLKTKPKNGALGKAGNVLIRVKRLAALMLKERPDRILSFMENANFPSVVAAWLTGNVGRLSVSVRNDPLSFSFQQKTLIPVFYGFSSKVVAVSVGVGRALVRMGVPESKIQIIPNPVSVPCSGNLVSDHGFPLGRFVLAVGRLHHQKGFDRLLRAFNRVEDSEVRLVILGEGAERSFLERLAVELGLVGRVHFAGSVPDPFLWYRRAACLVLSSRYEGCPNVLMEAMACGCPVVSYDCNYGPSEIIEDGVNGLLVKKGDVAGLAKAVTRVLQDGSLRRRLARNALQRVTLFNIENIAPLWLKQ